MEGIGKPIITCVNNEVTTFGGNMAEIKIGVSSVVW